MTVGGHTLAVRLDSAGDVLLAGPAIRALAAGSDRLTLACGPKGLEAAGLLPGVDDVIEVDAPWVPLDPDPFDRRVIDEFARAIERDLPDRGVIFTSEHQSPLPVALLLRLAGVPFVAATSADHAGTLLDVRLRPTNCHEVERGLALAAACGDRLPDGDDRLRLRSPLPRAALPPRPYVVLHPGASVPARAVPARAAAGFVERAEVLGRRVVVTGAAQEVDAALGDRHGPLVTRLGGCTSLAELAAVIAGADAVVVGNTGPAHLAAAVGTPVVSVFAPVVPWFRWAPWRVPTRRLGHQDISCAGCRARACPREGQPCVGEVTARALWQAVDELTGVAAGTTEAHPIADADAGAPETARLDLAVPSTSVAAGAPTVAQPQTAAAQP